MSNTTNKEQTAESNKFTYFRLDFKNCSMPYDYTICPEFEISDQMSEALQSFDSYDSKDGEKPEITLTPVVMSHEEYSKWFMDNVEANA